MGRKDKKKSHGFRNFIIFLVVIAIAVAGGLIYFKGNIPEQVKYTAEDEISFYEKANIDQGNYTFDMMDLLTGNVVARGSVDVDATFTSEELTAFLQGHSLDMVASDESYWLTIPAYGTMYSGSTAFTDFNAWILGEDMLALSANVSSDIDHLYELIPGLESYGFIVDRAAGANVYFVLGLTYEKTSGFNVVVHSLYANGVPVPQGMVNKYEPQLTSLLNRALENKDVFDIDVFKIESDEIIFKGRLPEYLEKIY